MQYIYFSIFFYLIIFTLLFAQIREEKFDIKKASMPFIILSVFILIRIGIASAHYGHPYDIKCFTLWAERLAAFGPAQFYAPDYFADYPPGYMLVLYLIGMVGRLFGMGAQSNEFALLVKLPAILADGAIGFMLYYLFREKIGNKNAKIIVLLFLLNPVLILNSAFWGQIDSFFTLFLLIAIYLLYQKKYILSAFIYTICALIKPQAFIFAPVFLCGFLESKNWRMMLKAAFCSALTMTLAGLPFFGLHLERLINKYAETLGSYNYATVNAHNIYALFGLNWVELKGPIWSAWQYLILAAITLFAIQFYIKSRDEHKLFYMAYLLITTVFALSVKMHERYIFPALILILVCYLFKRDKRLLWLFLAQTAAQLFSIGLVYINAVTDYSVANANTLLKIFSIFNILILIFSIYWGVGIFIPQGARERKRLADMILPKTHRFQIIRKDIVWIIIVTIVYGLIAIYQLGDISAPQSFYFTNEQAVILDLQDTKPIAKLMLYMGIGDANARITLSSSADGAVWSPMMVVEDKEKTDTIAFSPSFCWKEYQTETEARFIRLSSTMKGQMLGEAGLFSSEGMQYPIITANGENALADEQETVPLRRSYLNSTYFDEIYHARTAYEIVNELPIYETTHPPLGKVLMSWGIMLFGMTPFGWRVMGMVFGCLMLPVLYIMLKKMLGRSGIALGGTILFAVDFMHFSLTRIATIDSFVTLFIMLSYLFMLYYVLGDFYKRPLGRSFVPLGLCGVFFALAASTKWIGLYAALGLAVLLIIYWFRAYLMQRIERKELGDFSGRMIKTVAFCLLFFIIVPMLIYFSSYLPQMRYDLPEGKQAVTYVWENQMHMLNYHGASVVAHTHPFSSKWYSWLVIGRPLWAYMGTGLSAGLASTIVIMGNPLIWWLGLLAMLCILCWFAWRDARALYLLIAYFAQLLPWVFVARTTFIYHYFSCVPFMIIGICYLLEFMKENRIRAAKYIKYYYLFAIVIFIIFYPALSGLVTNQAYIEWLKWLPEWTF